MHFEYNKKIKEWEALTDFHDQKIALSIYDVYPEADLEAVSKRAISQVDLNWERIQKNIIDSLHRTYNEVWSNPEEDLPVLSQDKFLEKIILNTVKVLDDHALSLYFSDSNIFGGHTIDLFWTEEDKMYDATLIG